MSDDETVRFKSYLMNLGISDPVTRDTHGSGQEYFMQLANEITRVLEKPVRVIAKSRYLMKSSSFNISFFAGEWWDDHFDRCFCEAE